MSVVAYDFFAGSGVANADLDTRVADCRLPWLKTTGGGFPNSCRVDYIDSAADGKPKRLSVGNDPSANYLAFNLSLPLARASARFAVLNSVGTARGFFGIGFCNANGDGYFGGWTNNATPRKVFSIYRSNGAVGSIAAVATSGISNIPYTNPFARLLTFEYERGTGDMRVFWDGALRVSGNNAAVAPAPVFPAVLAHRQGLAVSVDAFLEVVYEEL